MSDRFGAVDAFIESNLGIAFPAAQIAIRIHGETAHESAFGWLDPEQRTRATTLGTRFDLASVSKLFAVAAFMSLIEEGRVGLDQPVCEVLPEFGGVRAVQPYPHPLKPGEFVTVASQNDPTAANASEVTFRHLLSHNSGLPAWLPLWKMDATIEQRRAEALATAFAYPIAANVVYSDIGLMLIGFAIERLTGASLREVVRERVTDPLNLRSAMYGPIGCEDAAPTEFYAHQGRRMCGEVHDENAWSLGGASGHAGVFAHARDVADFGEALRMGKLLKPETLREMTRLQAQSGIVRRGLGFALWSISNEASGNPLSPLAFGHTGFTGTSLWMDPLRGMSVACLTNHVYYGRNSSDTLAVFRVGLNRIIADLVKIEG